MNTGLLIAFVIVAVWFLLIGFSIGVLVEHKSLLKWFEEELGTIEERYKRKYEEDGENEWVD